jgi:hydrogenase maturation protease
MDGPLKRVLLVGCEPATFGDEEGKMGLSDPVETAVEEATWVVSNLVQRILEEGKTKPVN